MTSAFSTRPRRQVCPSTLLPDSYPGGSEGAGRSVPLTDGVGADVGDAEPAAAGRGQGDADVPGWGAGQVSCGELARSGASGDGGPPVHSGGAGRDRVAARVIAGGHPRVEDDLPGADRPAEVDLQVLAGGLG